jgi:hypothetical protein
LAAPPNWENRKEETNVKAFISHYGASPTVCQRIWFDLQTAVDPSLCVGAGDDPLYLLLALRYLKAYPNDAELCGFFRINSPGTIRKWKNKFVDKLARLLQNKVLLSSFVCTIMVPCSAHLS